MITLKLAHLDDQAAALLGALWLNGHLGDLETFDACLLVALERGLALAESALERREYALTQHIALAQARGDDLPDYAPVARASIIKRLDAARVRFAIAHAARVLPRPLLACLLVELGARSLAHEAQGLTPTATDLCPEEEGEP